MEDVALPASIDDRPVDADQGYRPVDDDRPFVHAAIHLNRLAIFGLFQSFGKRREFATRRHNPPLRLGRGRGQYQHAYQQGQKQNQKAKRPPGRDVTLFGAC